MHEDLFPRRSYSFEPAGAPGARAASAALNRPLRSEREAREGRQARAALDRLALGKSFGALLLSKDTPTGWGGVDRPGRFVVAESVATRGEEPLRADRDPTRGEEPLRADRDPTRGEEARRADRDQKDQRWVAFWQDSASGEILAALGHRSFACALEDIARRHRAGRIAFVSGFQRRAGS
jgi:hypothetical protein